MHFSPILALAFLAFMQNVPPGESPRLSRSVMKYGYRLVKMSTGEIKYKRCEQCPDGYESSIPCNHEIRNESERDYCRDCPPGYAKPEPGIHSCKPCIECFPFQKETAKCTPMSFRECGDCFDGYGRTPEGFCGPCCPCPKTGSHPTSEDCPEDKKCVAVKQSTCSKDKIWTTESTTTRITTKSQSEIAKSKTERPTITMDRKITSMPVDTPLTVQSTVAESKTTLPTVTTERSSPVPKTTSPRKGGGPSHSTVAIIVIIAIVVFVIALTISCCCIWKRRKSTLMKRWCARMCNACRSSEEEHVDLGSNPGPVVFSEGVVNVNDNSSLSWGPAVPFRTGVSVDESSESPGAQEVRMLLMTDEESGGATASEFAPVDESSESPDAHEVTMPLLNDGESGGANGSECAPDEESVGANGSECAPVDVMNDTAERTYDEVNRMNDLKCPVHQCRMLIPEKPITKEVVNTFYLTMRNTLQGIDLDDLKDFARKIAPGTYQYVEGINDAKDCLDAIFRSRTDIKVSTLMYMTHRSALVNHKFEKLVNALHSNFCR